MVIVAEVADLKTETLAAQIGIVVVYVLLKPKHN